MYLATLFIIAKRNKGKKHLCLLIKLRKDNHGKFI